MYQLKCKICKNEMCVNPPVMRQKKTRCLGCNKLQSLSAYWKSDVNGFYYDPEARKKEVHDDKEIKTSV